MHCGIKFKASLLHPKYFLSWVGVGLFSLISLLPTSARHAIGRKIGERIYYKKSKRYNTVNTNLEIAFPKLKTAEREALIRQHLQWYGCALVDYSLLFFASKPRLKSMLRIEGQEYIDSAVKQDQPVMILLAHSVMLEFGPAALGYDFECFGSYKTSKNALLDWLIAKSRCRHVSFVVSREAGLRKLVKSLEPGKVMIFLPDEDLGSDNAVFVPFFGKDKATLTTTARIAKMTKAVALPAFSWYDLESKQYVLKILPPLKNYPSKDKEQDAEALNQSLEMLIKQHPEQYMWLMKWYKTRPNNDASVY
ncbi:MAG: lysophospholipid acyltransferase family protein [Cocleimonas sp.]